MKLPRQTAVYQTYTPRPHQRLWHHVPPRGAAKLLKVALGGWGSGKSTMCIEEGLELAMKMPEGNSCSVRDSIEGRGEISIVQQELKPRLSKIGAHWNGTNCFTLPNGHKHWVLPADDPERFGSFPLCWFWVNEGHESKSPRIWHALSGRLRDKAACINGSWYLRGYLDARGVSHQHWINTELLEKGWNVREPETRDSAVNPNLAYILCKTSENKENLPPGYEEDLRREHEGDIAWIKSHLDGEIGYDVQGRAVFADAYDPERHVVDRIVPDDSLAIMRGWDFGYRAPGVVFSQYTRSGRLLILRELAPKNLSTDSLVDRAESLRDAEFPRHGHFRDFCDFAGRHMTSGADERDIETVETRLETELVNRRTSIEYGLGIMRKLMLSSVKVGGKLVPRFAVDRSCTTVIDALGGGYYYPEERLTAPPIKGGSAVAVIDGIRYTAQEVVEEGVAEIDDGAYPRSMSFGRY